MEKITETERMMLVKKKEDICELTLWIIHNPPNAQNEAGIKGNMTKILARISTIASYSNIKNDSVDRLENLANLICSQLDIENYALAKCMLEVFCNAVNSLQFDFTKKGLKINIPKIDISVFRMK